MMDALEYLGWYVNVQDRTKRTPLHIAAAQGSYDAVVRLLAAGANIKYVDARGNDALDDAIKAGDHKVMSYLIENALVRNQCTSFEDNIFSKGFSSALGIFNRKFEDVEITLQNSKNKTQLLTLIGANITAEQAQTYVTSNALAAALIAKGQRILSTSTNTSTAAANQTTNTNNTTSVSNASITTNSSQSSNSTTNTSNLQGNSQSDTTQRVMQVFFSTQELYIRKVINRQEEVLQETFQAQIEGMNEFIRRQFNSLIRAIVTLIPIIFTPVPLGR